MSKQLGIWHDEVDRWEGRGTLDAEGCECKNCKPMKPVDMVKQVQEEYNSEGFWPMVESM